MIRYRLVKLLKGGLTMTIMVGIDMHVKTLVCEIGYDRGEPKRVTFPNDLFGHLDLFNQIEGLKASQKATDTLIAYESSGLGYLLYDKATARGYRCAILAPTKIPKGAKAQKHKNDKRDAHDIYEVVRGHVLAGNHLPEIWVLDLELRGDRDVQRTLFDLGLKTTQVKNQIQTLLKKYGLKKPEKVECWTRAFMEWLDKVKERLSREFGICLKSLLNQLSFLINERNDIEKEVERISQKERYKKQCEKLMEIKGVGLKTAMTFLTEVGDVTRFKNRRGIGGYLGLAPSSFESGDVTDRKGRITRDGPYRVRSILNQSVWVHILYNGEEKAFYDRIVERNPKRKKKAVVACMRRLAVKMWHKAYDCVMESRKEKPAA
jgi:transposase